MKRLKNILFILVLISSFTFLNSCGVILKAKAKNNLTEEKGAIPPEFGAEKTTILFITHHRSYNRYLKKNVKNKYKGDYEIISSEELNSNTKYRNTEKFRYIFDYNYNSYTYAKSDLSSGYGQVKRFYILDRENEKKYTSRITSAFWSKLQKVYLKKLNEKLPVD